MQVAVRMRVFNAREKTMNAERVIRMVNLDKGSKTYIKDPETGDEKCALFCAPLAEASSPSHPAPCPCDLEYWLRGFWGPL